MHSRMIAIADPRGQWFAIEIPRDDPKPEPEPKPLPKPEAQQLAVVEPTDPLQEVSRLAGRIVHLVRAMPHADAQRARSILYATASTLEATTYLDARDQKIFQQGLRDGK